jgi:hypothetical protein
MKMRKMKSRMFVAPGRAGGADGQQVRFGHHADDLAFVVDHGKAADPVRPEAGGQVPVGHVGPDRHDIGGHHVFHVCVRHGLSIAGARPGPEET